MAVVPPEFVDAGGQEEPLHRSRGAPCIDGWRRAGHQPPAVARRCCGGSARRPRARFRCFGICQNLDPPGRRTRNHDDDGSRHSRSICASRSAAPPAPGGVAVADAVDAELLLWNNASASGDLASYQAYLAAYPAGRFAGQARKRMAELSEMAVAPLGDTRGMVVPDAPEPSPVAEARNDLGDLFRVFVANEPPAPSPIEAERPVAVSADRGDVDSAFKSEADAWAAASSSSDPMAMRMYILLFPNGQFVDEAFGRLAELSQTGAGHHRATQWPRRRLLLRRMPCPARPGSSLRRGCPLPPPVRR